MEFWGVEVQAGQPLKVKPDVGRVIHISQAALGEGKKEKGSELIPLRVKINGDNFIVGSLSAENVPQVSFDLVFEKAFELSHDWKNGSVYFCGYSADNPFLSFCSMDDEDEFDSEDSEEDEDVPLAIPVNGKIEPKAEEAKAAANKAKASKPESSAKPKVTVEPKKDESDEDDETEEDEDESDDEDMMDASDDIGDSGDEDDSDEDDLEDKDEETPKKAADASKKRPTASATKTPVAAKKAKLGTPQKTDGKKGGGHTATPHPSKHGGKIPANSDKSKDQTPKSENKIPCKSCNRTFNSDSALQSHTKAKHGSK